MALKDSWKDKVDNVDDILAEDINMIAHSAIENEEKLKNVQDGLGDINTALEELHIYAQNLISGGEG